MSDISSDSFPVEAPVQPPGVGATLRQARVQAGKSLSDVAGGLRIRQQFLQALEEGRHRDLPGGTYAIGFLRTYADFLGLDAEEMVRRFRAEASGALNPRSELLFPSPQSEGRIPGGAVLFVGVLLAGLGYGGWYLLSQQDVLVAERTPSLPDRLATVLGRQANVVGETTTPPPTPRPDAGAMSGNAAGGDTDVPDSTPEPTSTQGNDAPPPAEESAPPVKAAEPAPVKPVAKPANEPAFPVKPVESTSLVRTAEPKPVEVVPAKPPEPVAAKPVAANAVEPAAAKPVEPAAPKAAVAPAGKPADPALAGAKPAAEEPSRIQLLAANDDCWIQVREMDGQLLISRLLRRGEGYAVPNRPGLTLMAGNAGALELTVDGQRLPSLGSPGQVRRDIRLDPAKLLAN